MTVLKESYSPEIGPFYLIDGVVYADTESVRDVFATSQGFKDSDNTHYQYWKSLQTYLPELKMIDYDYYPRGRVVYNTNDNKYYLYADKCILSNKDYLHSVFDELGLRSSQVIIGDDEHYQCHECNLHYENILENQI